MRTANQPACVGGPTYADPADNRAHGASSNPTSETEWQLLPKSAVCRLFGNINPSTLYRGIRVGRYPKPIRVGPNSSRWVLTECQSALRAMMKARS
jgi:predicted DNA-binding transcriptional regulator AlpA